ncbi:IgGFc-binding protein, partial [Ophiophagus hannah]
MSQLHFNGCSARGRSSKIARNLGHDNSLPVLEGLRREDGHPCKVKLCRPKETCQVKDGQAVCVPDYTGHCWCWGDPHCHTFDGYSYDFQGTCSYVLIQSTGVDQSLVPFSVVIKNENRGDNKAVSYVKLVSIRVYEQVISIHKQENGRVRCDDPGRGTKATQSDNQ